MRALIATATRPAKIATPKQPLHSQARASHGLTLWGISTNAAQRHNLKAGNYVAADVLGEIDRKIDDGLPGSGRFQFSTYAGAGTPPVVGGTASGCTDADSAAGRWLERGGSDNCGAAILLH